MFLQRIVLRYFEPDTGAGGGGTPDPVVPPSPHASAPDWSPEFPAEPAAGGQQTQGADPQPAGAGNEPPASQAAAKRAVLDALASSGYDMSGYESDDDVLSEFENLARSQQELEGLREHAEIGRRVLPDYQKFQEWQRSQAQQAQNPAQQAQQPAEPPKPGSRKLTPAPYDPEWEQRAKFDVELGRYVPLSLADKDAADGLNNRRAWQRQALDRMTDDPVAFLHEFGLEEHIKTLVDAQTQALQAQLAQFQSLQKQQEQQTYEQRAEKFLNEHGKSLFVADAKGNLTQTLTPLGKTLSRIARTLQAAGKSAMEIQDEIEFAVSELAPAASNPAAPPAAPPTADQIDEQRKQSFLERGRLSGAHAANRDAAQSTSFLPGGPPPNVHESASWESVAEPFLRQQGLLP